MGDDHRSKLKQEEEQKEVILVNQEHMQDEVLRYIKKKSNEEEEEEEDNQQQAARNAVECAHILFPFLIVILSFMHFVYQSENKKIKSSIEQRNAYREIWLSMILCPIGALIRMKLGISLNAKHTWIPIGTFIAN